MGKFKLEKNEESRQRRNTVHERVLRTFSAAVPKLGHILDEGHLSAVEQRECVYGLNMLRKIDTRTRAEGCPTVYLVEFLNRISPNYNDQVRVLDALQIGVLSRFFSRPFPKIKIAFAEHGQKLPIVLETIYLEYHSTENVRTRRRTRFEFGFGPQRTA